MPYAGKYKDSVFFTGATIIYRFSIKFDPTDRASDRVRSAECGKATKYLPTRYLLSEICVIFVG